MRKIILIDVDGTLLDYENNLPDSAVKAIRLARARGHRVYICTGRSKAEVYENIWDIGLDGMIGGNGSYIENDGEVIMHQLIDETTCREVVDWLHEQDLEFYLESNAGLFASEHFEEKGKRIIQMYSKRKGKEDIEHIDVRSVFPDMIFGGKLYRSDVNKISFILRDYEDHIRSKERFPQLQCGTWGGKGEEALFGDLGVKDIDKAVAIECLLQHLHAKKEDTIAFGDAKIDIPMLAYCEIGIAMGSGGEEIKAMADFVTKDVDDDGLYHAFEKYRLL